MVIDMGDQTRLFVKNSVIGLVGPQKVLRLELITVIGHVLLHRRFLKGRFAGEDWMIVFQSNAPQHPAFVAWKISAGMN